MPFTQGERSTVMTPEIQRYANALARQHGFGTADRILYGSEDKIVHHTFYGYRKRSTGEYVSNSYRDNFGWKNTYYQPAYTVVMLRVF